MTATGPRAPLGMVYIVDDDAAVRDSLALLLSLRGLATGSFARAEDFLRVVGADTRGCAVIDLKMPGISGLMLQQLLREKAPKLSVVVITGHGDLTTARQAMKSNAIDFLEKPFDDERLLAAIHEGLMRDAGANKPAAPLGSSLSPRERQVIELICEGLDNTSIGRRLDISPRTVEVHKARLMQKIGARGLSDLFRYAAQGR